MNVTKYFNPRLGFLSFGSLGLLFFWLTAVWIMEKTGPDFFEGAMVMGLFSSALLIVAAIFLRTLSTDGRVTKLANALVVGMIGAMIESALIGAFQPTGLGTMLTLGALFFGMVLTWPKRMSAAMLKRGLIAVILGNIVFIVSVLVSTAIYKFPSLNPIVIFGFFLGAILTFLIAQPWRRD